MRLPRAAGRSRRARRRRRRAIAARRRRRPLAVDRPATRRDADGARRRRRLALRGLVARPDGSEVVRVKRTAPAEVDPAEAAALGREAGEELVALAGADFLHHRSYISRGRRCTTASPRPAGRHPCLSVLHARPARLPTRPSPSRKVAHSSSCASRGGSCRRRLPSPPAVERSSAPARAAQPLSSAHALERHDNGQPRCASGRRTSAASAAASSRRRRSGARPARRRRARPRGAA